MSSVAQAETDGSEVLEVERLQCLGFTPVILHLLSGFHLPGFVSAFISQIALAIRCYKDPYFKYRGEGSQIFWICFGGAVGQGAV